MWFKYVFFVWFSGKNNITIRSRLYIDLVSDLMVRLLIINYIHFFLFYFEFDFFMTNKEKRIGKFLYKYY